MAEGTCAYIHCRPDGSVFYVGKGTLRRAHLFRARNPHYAAVVSKYGQHNILVGVMECSSPAGAFLLEQGLIRCFRRSNIELTNQTDGGDGLRSPSSETRQKMSRSRRAALQNPDVRRRVFDASRAAVARPDVRLRMSMSATGRRLSQSTRDKVRAAATGRRHTAETKARLSKMGMGHVVTDATRAKLSAALAGRQPPAHVVDNLRRMATSRRGVPRPQETRDRISKTRLARFSAVRGCGI